jgi:hypothetical protein
MAKLMSLLLAHVVLLALASTCFTIVTGVGDGHFQWEPYRYFSQSGWGLPYQFAYGLPVVLAYLAAYGLGVSAYCVAFRSGSQIIGLLGIVLCMVGVASFTFELTHWLVEHYRSWIASAPIALFVLAPAAAIQQCRRRTSESINSKHALPVVGGHESY